MTLADWIVLALCLLGTLVAGLYLSRLVKSSSDLFAAGGQSPWWLSGLSAFMTMFSANTFVVWGGIAYQYGFVAIAINLCYGIAAIAAGFSVAGKWKRMGIRTPAEYIERRFGRAALHFYTWFMMTFRVVGTGGALYAIATLVLAAIGDQGMALSPTALNIAIGVFALIVVGYTMVGGLWAVLVTDTLQFIILNLAVLFVIPLSLIGIGGLDGFLQATPEGFTNLTSVRFSWLFLVGWVAIHYFMIGAEWAFVQRYLCVPTPKDARKSAFLFGGLYLFSPFLWLLPPLLWRVHSPIPVDADPATITRLAETAYILSCKAVLPSGMLGLMITALFSATASMISSQLNVFSGVLTENIYRPLARDPSEKRLLFMGRVFTCLLGLIVAAIAMATPAAGGAAKLIISITELMVTPLLAPVLVALFVPRIGVSALWWTVGICFPLGLVARFTDLLANTPFANSTFTGVILPLAILATMARFGPRRSGKSVTPLFGSEIRATPRPDTAASASVLPLRIVACCLGFCVLLLFALIPLNAGDRSLLAIFTTALTLLTAVVAFVSRTRKPFK